MKFKFDTNTVLFNLTHLHFIFHFTLFLSEVTKGRSAGAGRGMKSYNFLLCLHFVGTHDGRSKEHNCI
jgi:hypothetical protein